MAHRKIRANADTRSDTHQVYRRSVICCRPDSQGKPLVVVCLSGYRVEEVSIRPEHVFVLDRLPPVGGLDRPFRSLPEIKISPFPAAVKLFRRGEFLGGVVPAAGVEPATYGL